MPGALTHIFVGAILATMVHFYHYRLEFSMSVFVGSLLSDALKFGITAIKQLTWHLFFVTHDTFFDVMATVTNDVTNWLTLGFFVFGVTLLLYHYHIIQKKKMEEYDELFLFLLLGIVIHLLLDGIFTETNVWF